MSSYIASPMIEMPRRGFARALPALNVQLLVFLVLAIMFNFTTPLGEAPDEESHFGVIRNYVFRGLLQGGYQHEAFQPPLYYVIGSFLARPFNLQDGRIWGNPDFSVSDPASPPNLLIHTAAEDWPFTSWVWAWHVLRLYSAVLVLIGLIATWKLARLTTPGDPLVAHLAVGLIGSSPGVLFIASAVNNDNLAFAIAALTMWQSARIATGARSRTDWLLAGMLVGAGYVTKLSLLTVVAPVSLTWYCSIRDSHVSTRRAIGWVTYMVLGGLITGGWWAAHMWLNHGEFLGLERTREFNPSRGGPITWSEWAIIVRNTWQSYWLKYLHLRQPSWIYDDMIILPILAGLGWIRLIFHREGKGRRAILTILTAQTITTVLAWGKWTIEVPGTDQARLFAPAYPALSVLASIGLLRPWSQWAIRRGLASVICIGLVVLSMWTILGVIRPLFTPPATEPSSPMPPQVAFGGELGLDYQVTFEAAPLQAGHRIIIDTRWRALVPIHRDLWVQFKLQPEHGNPVVVDFGAPSRGVYATDRWPAGRIVHSCHTIVVPQGVPPGTYRLIASVRPPGESSWLPVLVNNQVIGEEVVLAEATVAGP